VWGTIVSEPPFSQAASRLIVAHRGASAEQPENTLAAFERAIEVGAPAVEFDVRITADGEAVVMHDAGVDRTTDGSGLVHDMTLVQVQALGITDANGGSHHVPTLWETLAALSGRVAVDVEIKNIPGEPDFDPARELAVEAVLRALDEVAFVGPVIVSSFSPLSIARSRALQPDVPTGLLTDFGVDAEAALAYASAQGHPWVLPYAGKVREAGPGFPSAVHQEGMLLGTWLTDDPADAVALFASGVDAVATNDPRRVVAACAEAFDA
jgi:glycerophosphoryl diester phosphodiesterase